MREKKGGSGGQAEIKLTTSIANVQKVEFPAEFTGLPVPALF